MRAFGAYEKILPQLRDRTDVVAIGAFGPKTFRRLLLFRGAGQNAFFDASEPTALAFLALPLIPGQVRFKIVVMFHGLMFVFCHSNGLLFGAATVQLLHTEIGGKDSKQRPFMAIPSY